MKLIPTRTGPVLLAAFVRAAWGPWSGALSVALCAACGVGEPEAALLGAPTEPAALVQPLIGTPPQLVAMAPNTASATGGISVTLTGKNFRPGAKVSVSGIDVGWVNLRSSTELSFYLPGKPGAFGRVPVTVTHPDGKSATRSDLFYYYSDHMQAQAANVLPVSTQLGDVVTADLNGDAKPDVLSISGNQVVALLSNGDGTLQDIKLTAAGASPLNLLVADFNGDGKRDVAVTQYYGATVTVLLGNGDGTFKAGSDIAVASLSNILTLGDLNGDGKADLLASPASSFSFTGSTALLSKGDGTFTSVPLSALNDYSGQTAIADFNRDGKADFLTFSSSGDVKVFSGKGDGTFDTAAPKRSAFSGYIHGLIVADLNGDGNLDLAISKSSGGAAGLMFGKGDGTFAAMVDVGPSGGSQTLVLGDVTSDGKPDLVVGSYGSTQYVLPGNGDGTYGAALFFQTDGLDQFQLADFDSDGKLDILTAPSSSGGTPGGLRVLYGNGSGSFADPQFLPGGTTLSALKVADLNADGKLDVLAASYDTGTVSVLLGGRLFRFAAGKTVTVGKGPGAMELGDLNGDGKTDLVVSNYDSSNVSVLLGNGDGSFRSAVSYACGSSPSGVVIADFNGDGKPDVATSNFDADSVSVLLNTGGGALGAAKNYSVAKSPAALAAGDLDGDGKADLVASGSDTSVVSVLLATSTGFATAKSYAVGKTPAGLTISDLNGDGKADLAVTSSDGNSISVLLGIGAGKLATAVSYATCSYPTSVFARDLDHDNRVDLAVSCEGSPQVGLLMGFGDGAFFPSQLWLSKRGSGPLAMDDMDGDGKADFIMGAESQGLVSILLNRSP